MTSSATAIRARRTEPSQAVQRLGEAMRRMSIGADGAARLLGRDPTTVRRWLRLRAEPRRDSREAVLALDAVLDRLAGVIEPDAIEGWLLTPLPALGGQRPADLIRAGRPSAVLDLADALGEGVFA